MVYQSFLEHHLDYVFFLYGMSFYILALYCFLASKSSDTRLHWEWLGLFAAIHGTNELVELALRTIDELPHFALFRYILLLASYACLMEFGRAGTAGPEGGNRWRAAYPFLVAASLAGAWWGFEALNTTVRYAVGLPAGLWASAALFRAYREHGGRVRSLAIACMAMAAYALTTGLVVPAMPFMPASAINYDTFLAVFGINIQILRLTLIIVITLSMVAYFRTSGCVQPDASPCDRQCCSFMPLAIVLVFLLVGWPATELVGGHVEDEASENLMSRTLTAAAAILPERVAALSGTPADEGTPAFEHLRNDLTRIKEVNPDFRFVYLMGLRDGHEIFLVDAEPKDSKDYSNPGDVYPDATPQEIAEFKKGLPKVYPPYKDSWGTWVSGVAFIKDPATGEVLAMLGMDIDAKTWLNQVALARFLCMVIAFALSVITITLYFAWQRSREAAEQSAALRLAEQKLDNDKKLRDLVDSLGEGVIVQDSGGRVVFANPEAERLLGWGRGEMSGEPIADVLGVGREVLAGRLGGLDTALPEDGDRCPLEGAFTRADGTRLFVSYVSAPMIEAGKAIGAVTAFQDITGRKEVERQKNDFFAMVTHDLKSPLLVIQGFTDVLLDEKKDLMDTETAEMLNSIRDSGKKMLRMVNDFLTVSRLESGKLTLNEVPEDIGAVVTESMAELAPLAEKKGIAMTKDIRPGMSRVMFDRTHVQRAVTNLVHNAIYYTGTGGSVNVMVEGVVNGGKDYAVVAVSDSGPGIPLEDRGKVFDIYYRSSRTSGLKGSGLGLAIVKAVALAHGGKVELDSEDGKGSTFRLYIPRKLDKMP